MATTYDEKDPLAKLDELIESIEANVGYRSDGDEQDRLNYMVLANLRVARVGLELEYGDGKNAEGTPRWSTEYHKLVEKKVRG